MPPTPASVVEQWQDLPRAVLQDKVRQVVKRRDAEAKVIWTHVRANSVLAAQVRGALSALRAEVKGTRDEVMWTMWIDQARSVLDATPDKPSASDKPVASDKPAAEKLASDKSVAQKPAAEKPVVEKAAPAVEEKTVKKAAEKVTADQAAEPAAEEKRPERGPVAEITFTPQPVEQPRTAPAVVPPVLFQAPGA
ncbi:hypothetical protein [Kutzneria sp. 744]|uniref:hypothetical protein n=1 Tax=Kutzneria sp. (strain 744) TaxID=345341 RepID=UPI0003EEAAB8|nr:hypothetical protein [Kutzneria sp. 744]EWM17728.1 vegetative cell wall protein gp1 [Kutzneria sp. 744]